MLVHAIRVIRDLDVIADLITTTAVSEHQTSSAFKEALEAAADTNDVFSTSLLLAHKADIQTAGKAAIIAATKGHMDILRVLALHNLSDSDADEALLISLQNNYTEALDFLLPTNPIRLVGILNKACCKGNANTVRLLLDHKADPSIDNYRAIQLAQNDDEVVRLLLGRARHKLGDPLPPNSQRGFQLLAKLER